MQKIKIMAVAQIAMCLMITGCAGGGMIRVDRRDQYGNLLDSRGIIAQGNKDASIQELPIHEAIFDIASSYYTPFSSAFTFERLIGRGDYSRDEIGNLNRLLSKWHTVSKGFLRNYYIYEAEFIELSRNRGSSDMLRTAPRRAALMDVLNYLVAMGDIDEAQFGRLRKELQNEDVNLDKLSSKIGELLYVNGTLSAHAKRAGVVVGILLRTADAATSNGNRRTGSTLLDAFKAGLDSDPKKY